MSSTPILKKPKLEQTDDDDDDDHGPAENWKPMTEEEYLQIEREGGTGILEQEEALVALIDHRTREVDILKSRVSYYESQLLEAGKKLQDTEDKLSHLRAKRIVPPSKASLPNGTKTVKLAGISTSPVHVHENASRNQSHPRTELVIPAANPIGPSAKAVGLGAESSSRNSDTLPKAKLEKSYRASPDAEVVETRDKRANGKLDQKEHKDLIPLIKTSSSPRAINCYASNHIPSQHKRKLRSLVLCPVNYRLFATSALDGVVNLWQVHAQWSSASLLSSSDCASSKRKRWPEDIAWHPLGNSLFATYSADGGDSQISILNFNKTEGRSRLTYLEDKPHVKGIINSIMFMPWENTCFLTGGSDHAVVLWNEEDDGNWKPQKLHRNLHSSAVMGVAGLQQKNIVLSAGADKRIVGFDVQVGRADFIHQLDNKCMSVLPNPCDFNLFMVQTGIPEKQLRLFDIRLRKTQLHSFGFKQESSDSQSALINQAWSPDGLCLSSGSVDPVIHIFDIRYNSHKPSQSVRAHNRRVFKAVWHYTLPLLISISSDLHIGLNQIS